MKKVITKSAITLASALTSGAIAYAARSDAVLVTGAVILVSVVFADLSLATEGV